MMATETPTTTASPPAPAPVRHYAPFAALLSFLVPGLGQISQGRVGKGLLFFVCLYGMFFYGMMLGQWSNVFLPPESGRPGAFRPIERMPWLSSIINDRLAYAGQFWIGIAAWPALYHYKFDPKNGPPPSWVFWRDFQRMPPESASDVRDAMIQIESLQETK